MPSRRVRPRLACSTASPVPRRGKPRWVRPCRLAAWATRRRSPAPPSFSLPKRHLSSPGKSLLPMAARPPAEIFPFTFHRQGFHKVSIVTTHTHQTAPTQFVEANGIRFAYRRFGKATGVPLVFNQHYTGTMDHWDPAVTDSFAREREVILFNNAGVSSSSGEVPTSFEQMGRNAVAFIKGTRAPTARRVGILDRRLRGTGDD